MPTRTPTSFPPFLPFLQPGLRPPDPLPPLAPSAPAPEPESAVAEDAEAEGRLRGFLTSDAPQMLAHALGTTAIAVSPWWLKPVLRGAAPWVQRAAGFALSKPGRIAATVGYNRAIGPSGDDIERYVLTGLMGAAAFGAKAPRSAEVGSRAAGPVLDYFAPAFRESGDLAGVAQRGYGALANQWEQARQTIAAKAGDPLVSMPTLARLAGRIGADGLPERMQLSEAFALTLHLGAEAFAGRTPDRSEARAAWRQSLAELDRAVLPAAPAEHGAWRKVRVQVRTGLELLDVLNAPGVLTAGPDGRPMIDTDQLSRAALRAMAEVGASKAANAPHEGSAVPPEPPADLPPGFGSSATLFRLPTAMRPTPTAD